MSKRDEYQANAAECRRMASITRKEVDKQNWLDMARYWEAMIERMAFTARDQQEGAPASRTEAPKFALLCDGPLSEARRNSA
jgi:hypothetical protein